MKRKIFIFLFSFAILALGCLLCSTRFKATGLTTSNKIVVNGAAVRTTGNAGLKFTASIGDYDTTNVTEYGIAIAFGTAEANDDFCVGGTVNGKSVKSSTVTERDGKNEFHIVLYNIPNTSYVQDVTARAFVIDNGVTVYGEAVTVRNLAEVSLKALNDGRTGELLTTVASYISTNYKKGYDSYANGYAIDNAAYCYDPVELGQLFVADWNKFVDDEDEIDSITSNSKAKSLSLTYEDYDGADFYYSAKWEKWTDTITTTNISESNLYRFFKDSVYGPKWGWLLTVMRTAEADAANSAWQALAIQGDGTYSSKSLYAGQHMCVSLIGFFTKQKVTYGYIGVDFASAKRNMYDNLYTGSYANTTVYNSFLRDHALYKVGASSAILPAAKTPELGYDWVSYEANSVPYAAESIYPVTSSNVQFKPKFELHNYTISYFRGSDALDLSPSTYTIVNDTFSLPNYEEDHYIFEGWYDDSEFTHDPITSIERGSHENIELYAKTTSTPYSYVNVTLNLDGGNWALPEIVSHSDPEKTVIATYYNTYHGSGYEISFVDNGSTSRWFQYIVLEKTNTPNVYRIIGKANGSTALPANYDAVISYHSSCTSEYKTAVSDIYKESNIGKYITIENKPATSGSGKSITIKLYPTAAFTNNYVKNMIAPEDLPIPAKTGYFFDGWRCSLNSLVVTSFPGYEINPGNITYTAIWTNETPLSSTDTSVITTAGPTKFVNKAFTGTGTYFIGASEYTVGTELFTSVSDAVAAASANDIIYVFAGSYNETFTISTNNISIIGPNYQVNGDSGSRSEEAEFIGGTITLAKNLAGCTISGLKFSGDSLIVNTKGDAGTAASPTTNLNGFTFSYNKVVSSLTSGKGFIYFVEAGSSYSHDLVFAYNEFSYTGSGPTAMLYLDNLYNIDAHHNVFKNITGHALYVNDTTKGASGQSVLVNNNVFNTIGGNAIHLNYISYLPTTPATATAVVEANNNTFTKITGIGVFFGNCRNDDYKYLHVQANGNTFNGKIGTPIKMNRAVTEGNFTATGNTYNSVPESTYYVVNGLTGSSNKDIVATGGTYSTTPTDANFSEGVTH